jgi:tetratricopeptide (TPR) repeat protein
MLVLLVLALAFLLASFPASNSELWLHLAHGRLLAHGEYIFATDPGNPASVPVHDGWLYDLLCYGLYSVLGGPGLVVVKGLLVVGLAWVLLRLSSTGPTLPARTGARIWISTFCTTLALVVMSARLSLQPATVSYLFLALTLWFIFDPTRRAPRLLSWPMVVLFVAWVNMDRWFVLGLLTVALVGLGQILDFAGLAKTSTQPRYRYLIPRVSSILSSLVVLGLVCLLNPLHIHAFTLPSELGWLPYWNYLADLGRSVAGVAYIPLVLLTLFSFVLRFLCGSARWEWQRFLPWLGLAFWSALQAKVIPFFAVVSGPVLAWNLQEAAASRPVPAGWVHAARLLTLLLVVALPVCAWPGWLQRAPFEPRRWAVVAPPSLERGAAATRRWHQEAKPGSGTRGLHLSAESVRAFAWFCPEDNGLYDPLLVSETGLPEAAADWRGRLRSSGINHVILYDPDRDRLFVTMGRLLEDPQEWPLLYLEGYLAVFGWRDTAKPVAADPFQGSLLDLNRLAFHPANDKKAPPRAPTQVVEPRQWWEAFWKPVPPRPIDQDEATLHLMHAELVRRSAPRRYLATWENSLSAAVVAAGGCWRGPADLLDAHLRLTLLRPQLPEQGAGFNTLPALDQLVYLLQQQFHLRRDDTPPALLYLAIRAARRAVAANPQDAQAHLVLGECYLRLLDSTRERAWGKYLPELVQLRRAQASAALSQAIALNSGFAQAHLSLSRLFGEMGYLDLTLEHLRAYHKMSPSSKQSREWQGQEDELAQLGKTVKQREEQCVLASVGGKVLDRAFKLWQEGLAGKARDLLLESDISAFGAKGMALELELLLRTGRPRPVWEWTGPEQRAGLGASYHWLRAQALAASGDYALAQEECTQLARSLMLGSGGSEPVPVREVMAVLIGRRVLDEMHGAGLPAALLQLPAGRFDFRNRVTSLAQSLRLEADMTVIRGLLALEEGDADEAEIAFRQALALWKDAPSAASGGGLDFNGRIVAQACLEWLQ